MCLSKRNPDVRENPRVHSGSIKGKLRVWMLQVLESWFERLERYAGSARESVAVCPDCGRNRYTGAPCVNKGAL
jgi:hypothetical protein